jgi:hypothetical protein
MIARPAGAFLLFSTGLLLAQTGEPPKPGPQHEKLGYFIGQWAGEGELKPSPFMPSGKFAFRERCEWFEGRFAVVCKSEGNGPAGPMKSMSVWSYSPEEKIYTWYGIESGPRAPVTVPRGTVEGATWSFTDESRLGGKKIRSRYTVRETSPISYTFTWEMLGEDGAWKTVAEGKATKTS